MQKISDSISWLYRRRKSRIPAAGGPTTLILDQYTDTDATPLNSHTIAPTNTPAASWALSAAGAFTIQSNKASCSNFGNISIASLNAGVSDCTIYVIVNGQSDTRDAAILFRYVDANNYWIADFQETAGADRWAIYENTSGVFTLRATAAKTFSSVTDFTLAVVLSGPDMTATVDGATQITYSSAVRQTATKHGIWAVVQTQALTFNDFTVTTP